jgi:hypothetical protein
MTHAMRCPTRSMTAERADRGHWIPVSGEPDLRRCRN